MQPTVTPRFFSQSTFGQNPSVLSTSKNPAQGAACAAAASEASGKAAMSASLRAVVNGVSSVRCTRAGARVDDGLDYVLPGRDVGGPGARCVTLDANAEPDRLRGLDCDVARGDRRVPPAVVAPDRRGNGVR